MAIQRIASIGLPPVSRREALKRTILAVPLFLFLFLVLASRVAESQAPSRAELFRKLNTCPRTGVKRTVLCGRFEVPEVRSAPGGRRLALNVSVLPAMTDSVLPDPLVFLAGGGVVPATRYAAFLTQAFPTLRHHRDILLVDQRGTWNSHPLACGDSSLGPSPTDAAREAGACMAELSARADLRAYSTAIAMDDLDAVREWLGYPALNLYGVSYGTKAAQVYMKQYPHRVRTAVLYGVVPIDAPTQLDLARFADHSLARVFALCAGDSECQAAFPGLPAEFDSVLGRLSRTPASVTLERPDGEAQTVTVTDRMVRDLVQTMLGSTRSIGRLPFLIHTAAGGDYGPITGAAVGGGPPPPRPAPRGLFLSILCGESIPLIDPDTVASATAGTFFGEAPVRSQMDACAQWPRSELPAGFWEPARADVPVLIISGDLDPITPPSYGEQVASQLPNARHLIVANRSHGDVDPCITGLFERFILAGGASGLDTTCTVTPAHLSFALRAEALSPAH